MQLQSAIFQEGIANWTENPSSNNPHLIDINSNLDIECQEYSPASYLGLSARIGKPKILGLLLLSSHICEVTLGLRVFTVFSTPAQVS